MADPRLEAAETLENVKNAVTDLLKNIGSIGKLTQFIYLKMLILRRAQFIEAIDSSNVAREMVKKLKPTARYLFGNNIKDVCRTLKEG